MSCIVLSCLANLFIFLGSYEDLSPRKGRYNYINKTDLLSVHYRCTLWTGWDIWLPPTLLAHLSKTCFMRIITLWIIFIIGPWQANLVLIAYASSEGSGEPAHPRSLARTSTARSYKQWVKRNLQTENQIPGPSEWLGMCN